MRSTDCGLAIADCGLDVRPANPQSPIRNPQLLAGALILASLPSLAGAQQPDSLPTDTLAAVVVSGVRLPTVRELAPGLAGRAAPLRAAARGAPAAPSRPGARARPPGLTPRPARGAPGPRALRMPGGCSRASASERTPRASRSAAC